MIALLPFIAMAQTVYDVSDFGKFLAECGVTPEQMQEAKDKMPAPMAMPDWASGLVGVRPSRIEGLGLFARTDLFAGQLIGPAKIGPEWTVAGRYANHWPHPNAEFVRDGDTLNMVALGDIRDGDELTVNYRLVRRTMEDSP